MSLGIGTAKWLPSAAAALGLALAVGGCAATPPPPEGVQAVDVVLRSDQRVELNGRDMPYRALPSALRAAGAGSATIIRVAFRGDPPRGAFSDLVSLLARAGYLRVVFVSQRKAESEVKTP